MDNLLPWYTLKRVSGIGNHLFKRLIDRFGSPDLVFNASSDDLLQVDGMTQRLVTALRHSKIADQDKRDFERVMQNGYKIVTLADPAYPPLLQHIPDPPPFLYVYGDTSICSSTKNIAIVGSRNATSYGISTTRRIGQDLAFLRITVVSGMARGIDTAAHEGALQGKGKTIAVLGSGLQIVYPAENRKLFHKIAANGVVISEFPLMTGPEAHNFPIRNRIISGISLGTVIVEATRKSGSLITARLAAEQNREVFAVPGSIHSFKSTGTHSLIKQGAKLVEHAQDIVEELSPSIQSRNGSDPIDHNQSLTKPLPTLSTEETLIFDALGSYPIHIDDLTRLISMEPRKVSSVLLQLELKGVVQQSPGKLFSKAVR
jgi:DNA processing protein